MPKRRASATRLCRTGLDRLSGSGSLRGGVLAKSAIDCFRIREKSVQVRVNQDDIRAFAVALGVLAADAGFDQLLRIFVSHGVFIIAHKLYALSGSSIVLKSIEFGHHVQYGTQRSACEHEVRAFFNVHVERRPKGAHSRTRGEA